MKLPIIVPGMLRATQGMRTGPETSATPPCDLLPGLQHVVDGVGCPEDVVCQASWLVVHRRNQRKFIIFFVFRLF